MLVRMIICTAIILTIVTTGRIKCQHIENLNEDEDDEDFFGEARESTVIRDDFYRKRRSDEEGFYHTLLSRSEPQHVFKRSHGTEDFAHTSNAALITDRDWSGSSKISDADRKELESLFSKLNADDGDAKKDVTRSIPDEDISPLDTAAKHYSSWLMAQPASKLAAALTNKAQVDNRLTRLFFQKRGLDKILPPNEGLEHLRTQTPPEPDVMKEKRMIIPAPEVIKIPQVAKLPEVIKLPEVVKDKRTLGNLTSSKLALENSDVKTLIMTGPKLCSDDSPKCLCTRACYPNTFVSFTPCKCDGNKADTPVKKSSIKKGANDPYARSWCASACHPLNVITANPCKCTGNLEISEKGSRQSVSKANSLNNLRPQIMPVEQAAKYVDPKQFPPQAPPIAKTATTMLKSAVTATNSSVVTAARSAMTHPTANLTVLASKRQSTLISSQMIKSANQSEPAESKSIEPIAHGHPIATKKEPGPPEPAGLFGTKDPIYITHPSYQGCFKDRKPVRDLPKRYTRFDTTPEACISECKYQNYKFAGVQYGYLCFCGNAFGRYGRVADKDCNSYCNGDPKRRCGAFWHNSVYSVDGKAYDPSDFDFAKVDEEERLFDKLSPPAKTAKRTNTKKETHANIQGVNAATHLMNAAQATLKAAQKLLPGVSKKHKIGKGGKRGKRDDDEEDAELMLERENVLTSLKAVHQILQKTNFEKGKRNVENKKRSISEDFDPYDPEDGKDLLKAYMSNVDAYNRQTRSVDEEEEDDETSEKDNFEYKRMSEGDMEDGFFIDKYGDAPIVDDTSVTPSKRAAEKDPNDEKVKEKRAITDKNKKVKPGNQTEGEKKDSISKPGNQTEGKRKDSISKPVNQTEGEKKDLVSKPVNQPEGAKKDSIAKPVNQTEGEKKDSISKPIKQREGEKKDSVSKPLQKIVRPVNDSDVPKRSTDEPMTTEGKAKEEKAAEGVGKRSTRNENISGEKEASNIREGSGAKDMKKKRSLPETKQEHSDGNKYRRDVSLHSPSEQIHATVFTGTATVYEGSGGGEKKKRSIPDQKIINQIHASTYEGSGLGEKRKRSLPAENKPVQIRSTKHEGSGLWEKKKRSLPDQKKAVVSKLRSTGSGMGEKKRRSIPVQERKSFPGFDGMLVTIKKRDLSAVNPNKPLQKKKKRVLRKPAHVPNAILPWDRKKRSLPDDIDLGAEIVSIYPISKLLSNGKRSKLRQRRDLTGNNLSDGALKMAARSDDINDIEASLQRLESIEKKDKVPTEESAGESGSGESEYAGSGKEVNSTQGEKRSEITKRSAEIEKTTDDDDKKDKIGETDGDVKLRADVEKGVDSLLNLVVELYKQQKTIKTFENSVRSLRHDILKELNLPTKDKHAATKKVRDAIQAAAKNRLHILTTSIEHKITQFAKNHPESVKQAKLATSLLPHIPLNDKKLAESKREIHRRSAEFDSIEDTFEEQTQLPSILKEHFKRNSENDVEEEVVLKPKKRSAEDSMEYEVKKTEEVNGEKTLSRMHRDVSESEEEGLDDDYEKLFM